MESTAQRAPRRIVGIHFDEHSGWAVGLEGYAGLATYSNSEGTKAHAMSGAVLRFRWQYFEVNGVIETSDYMNERWHSLGGSVGAFLPFTNWVDFDASIGLIARNYLTTDRLFGENGASVDSKALTLRFGVSDRPFDTLISPRLGAALVMAYDLKQHDVPWNYDVGNRLVASGVSKFGGFTAGVVMCLGLDLSVRDD